MLMHKWLKYGVFLGLVFFLAIYLVKPIGVSTQFVVANGITWNGFDNSIVTKDSNSTSGYSSKNTYLNKYAKNIAEPFNYSYIFVFGIIIGGFIGSLISKVKKEDKVSPQVWRDKFGSSSIKRYLIAFISGIFVLFGARLAGGCTSGHMMSGMMQTSVSGIIFTFFTFLIAIPVAMILFRNGNK